MFPRGWKFIAEKTYDGTYTRMICNFIKLRAFIGVCVCVIAVAVHKTHNTDILIRSNKMLQYAGIYLLQNYSTCFGCLSHPSSGVHETVTAASGTGHITYLNKNLLLAWPIRPSWRKVVALIL